MRSGLLFPYTEICSPITVVESFPPVQSQQRRTMRVMKNTFYRLLIALILTFISLSHAQAFDYSGARYFYGTNKQAMVGPDTHEDYSWGGISILFGDRLTSWFDVQTVLGLGLLEANGQSSPTVEGRLLGSFHYKFIELSVGGGLARILGNTNQPELASSWLYGILSAALSVHFNLNETMDLNLGYGIEHISSPFDRSEDGDSGWNVGTLTATIVFHFCPP